MQLLPRQEVTSETPKRCFVGAWCTEIVGLTWASTASSVSKPRFGYWRPGHAGLEMAPGACIEVLTCPCMFMMTTVLDLLHTTKCSGFLGSKITLLTVMSVPAVLPRDLKVFEHSVVFIFQICHTRHWTYKYLERHRVSKYKNHKVMLLKIERK